MKARMGRPRLPKGEARDELLTIRLSPDERHEVDTAAARAGVSVSAWIRKTVLAAAARVE